MPFKKNDPNIYKKKRTIPDNKGIDTTLKGQVRMKNFAREYVKNNGNATQTLLKIDPNLNLNSAKAVGSKYLQNESVKKEIQRILESRGLSLGWVLDKRLKFIEEGEKQLEGKGSEGTKVSANDVNLHLNGIERVIDKTLEADKTVNHVHIKADSVKEAMAQRHHLNQWFSEILDGEVINDDNEANKEVTSGE